jgi:hypothetical protein
VAFSHVNEYSLGVHASSQTTTPPSGVRTPPSARMVEPSGTWQMSNMDLGVHPSPASASKVLAAAGQLHAAMRLPSVVWVSTPDPEQPARRTQQERPGRKMDRFIDFLRQPDSQGPLPQIRSVLHPDRTVASECPRPSGAPPMDCWARALGQ